MGAVESGEKVVTGFFGIMAREPLSLALVVMNICLLGFFYILLTTVSAQREREINLLYADKKEVRELLAKCVVPDRRADYDDDDIVPLPRPRPSELGPSNITDNNQ